MYVNKLENYCPVSNLPFLSKILEKLVAKRLETHLSSNRLHNKLQSAYSTGHSTETALKLNRDIAEALDSKCMAALVLLDLSAPFDVIESNWKCPILDQILSEGRVSVCCHRNDDIRR